MYIVFLNPQGNFDKHDSFWTEHPDFGGQLVYVKELAIALAKLGHEVDIVTRRFQDKKFNLFSDTFDTYEDIRNVRIVRIPCGVKGFLNKEALWEHLNEWTDNIIDFFRSQKKLPDFVTGHYGDGGISAAILKMKTGIPYSFTGHSLGAQKLEKLGAKASNIESLNEKYRFAIRIEAERAAMKFSDLIFVSTTQERDEQYNHILYRDVTKEIQDRFVIAPPGANTEVFNPDYQVFDMNFSKKFDQICKRDIDKSRMDLPYIVSASRLDPKKNHIGLIKAFASNKDLQNVANLAISLRGVDNAFEDYSFSKPDEIKILDEIMRTIKENQLIGKIVFISINSQKELASFYRYMAKHNSVFTLTALYEPFGLAPIEAMSSGLPAAVTKYGGPSEVLEENGVKYGVLIDAFDIEDIAKGLMEVIRNHSTYQKLGITRVNQKYTWNATAEKYESAIENILISKTINKELKIHPFFVSKENNIIDLEFINKKFIERES